MTILLWTLAGSAIGAPIGMLIHAKFSAWKDWRDWKKVLEEHGDLW